MTYYSANDYTPWLKRPLKQGSRKHLKELPPCTWGTPLQEWMNRWEVRSNLNIPADIQAWQLCTNDIQYIIEPKGSQWIYEELKGKYRMLFYSGDIDGAVPTIGSQKWISTLGWSTDEQWRPYIVNDQVAGYLESYEGNLTFATVHGAGHMAPQFKREQTYYLIFNWLYERKI